MLRLAWATRTSCPLQEHVAKVRPRWVAVDEPARLFVNSLSPISGRVCMNVRGKSKPRFRDYSRGRESKSIANFHLQNGRPALPSPDLEHLGSRCLFVWASISKVMLYLQCWRHELHPEKAWFTKNIISHCEVRIIPFLRSGSLKYDLKRSQITFRH